MCWSVWFSVLYLLELTVTLQMISGPVHNIIHKLSGGCVISAWLQKVLTYLMLRIRLEWLLWLSRYLEACLNLHLPSTERVSLLISSASYPDFSSPVPILPLERWWKLENMSCLLGYKRNIIFIFRLCWNLLARFSSSATMYGANRLCLRNFAYTCL